ncbi:hypothetical protein EN829_038535 [Mesorhizobium sp. M00.F.Ca.ET.186.01.1.1]|nr:hypothetical protein EN829_038535 [Mesorhizobium sp. M00.F.Ca.ET.186.01.1.1]
MEKTQGDLLIRSGGDLISARVGRSLLGRISSRAASCERENEQKTSGEPKYPFQDIAPFILQESCRKILYHIMTLYFDIKLRIVKQQMFSASQ